MLTELKELVIKKVDAVYGETSGGANVTLATMGSLAEGSFAFMSYDGQLVTRTGTIQDLPSVDLTKPFTLYAMENGQLRSFPVIGKGRVDSFTNTAVARVLTFDVDNFPTDHDDVVSTGLLIIDSDRNPHDPKARKRAELPVDGDTVAAGAGNYEGDLATLLGTIDGIATAVGNGSGVITITLDADRNLQFLATGYLEGVDLTETAALEYANTLSAAEMAVLEREARAHQGETQHDLIASQTDMFTKASLVESGETYNVFFVEFQRFPARYVDGAEAKKEILCIASPDSVPGGSDADGTWAALIGAIADATTITDIP